MHRKRFGVRLAATVAATVLVLTACTSNQSSSSSSAPTDPQRAVVIVSGGGAVSPFTTPTEACKQGLAAGSTDTALRESMLGAGYQVYTSPAQIGQKEISSWPAPGAFSQCPTALPSSMTVNSIGDIDVAGEHLAEFLTHLNTTYQINTIDLVVHSMGGLFSRSAIKLLQGQGSPLSFRSLTTLGTPWTGAYPDDYALGDLKLSSCGGQPECISSMTESKKAIKQGHFNRGAAAEVNRKYLAGPDGWNERQGNVLDNIPVTLIGGNYFTLKGGDPQVWPNDDLVALASALAVDVSDKVLPHRRCVARPTVHSVFYTNLLKLPDDRAITWDPDVLNDVQTALTDAGTALTTPTRQGCP